MWRIELFSGDSGLIVIHREDLRHSYSRRPHWFRYSPITRSISLDSVNRVLALVARAASVKCLRADGWDASGEGERL